MLNKQQIKLVQTAVRAAGLRDGNCDGRYRLLLAQYRQPDGRPVTSCKQLNNSQLEDLLAICESHGWQMPGKPKDFYRKKAAQRSYNNCASYAQIEAIKHLAGDLGFNDRQRCGILDRLTGKKDVHLNMLTPQMAYNVIEALKAMVGRQRGTKYSNLKQVQTDMEAATDGNKKSKVG